MLVTFAGNGQVLESEQFVSNKVLLQPLDNLQNDYLETDTPSDERQTKVTLSHRLAASEFQHQKQLTPNYELVVEFHAEDLSAKHFVYISTIPDIQPWFELAAFEPNKSRISGWKDSRPLHPFSYIKLILS